MPFSRPIGDDFCSSGTVILVENHSSPSGLPIYDLLHYLPSNQQKTVPLSGVNCSFPPFLQRRKQSEGAHMSFLEEVGLVPHEENWKVISILDSGDQCVQSSNLVVAEISCFLVCPVILKFMTGDRYGLNQFWELQLYPPGEEVLIPGGMPRRPVRSLFPLCRNSFTRSLSGEKSATLMD